MKRPVRSATAASLLLILQCLGVTIARADNITILYRQETPQATWARIRAQVAQDAEIARDSHAGSP